MPNIYYTGKLTDHFSLDEYTINQTTLCTITLDAIEHWQMMEELRLWYGKPMKISAGFRTKAYNSKVGGNKNSNHLYGTACDVTMKVSKTEFLRIAKQWKTICKAHGTVGEIGNYANGWIHFGSHIKYSSTFYNWYTDSKSVQHNMYYTI